MSKTPFLAFVELNEVNFDYIRFYVARGRLPTFARLISRHGVCETRSEQAYEHLEPWIQWVTAHTGRTYAEHRVFRLGDIVQHDIPQIWEMLEAAGVKVGAVSPMNAKHRVARPGFFIPDPWTTTDISAPPVLVKLHRALCQAVNDNAQGKLTADSIANCLIGFLRYARPSNAARYLRLLVRATRYPWCKALFLDLLLADIFVTEVRRTKPGFATLFVNAAAHIQHHYMFCSEAYRGQHRNPAWYVKEGLDPIFEAYELYDHVIGDLLAAFPGARLMLATGLHQEPHEQLTYYWRLCDHGRFLSTIQVPHLRVEPRMSRDFLVICRDPHEARLAERRLRSAKSLDGLALFEVDNRGSDLFVMLTYPSEITRGFAFEVENERYDDLYPYVAFVAIKNGEHDGTGYFIDSGSTATGDILRFDLAEMPTRIKRALNIDETIEPARQRRVAFSRLSASTE